MKADEPRRVNLEIFRCIKSSTHDVLNDVVPLAWLASTPTTACGRWRGGRWFNVVRDVQCVGKRNRHEIQLHRLVTARHARIALGSRRGRSVDKMLLQNV